MQTPLELDYRNVNPSAAVEDLIRKQLAKLEHMCPRITGCRVTLESPHHHRRQGNDFEVTIRLGIPGASIAVGHDHGAAHDDLYKAIRDAFDAARVQLQRAVSVDDRRAGG